MNKFIALFAFAIIGSACQGRVEVEKTEIVCKCNGAVVDCDADCAPQVVDHETCRCNGTVVDCDAPCELQITCPDGETPFESADGTQAGCVAAGEGEGEGEGEGSALGTLTITPDDATPKSAIILGASTGVAMSKFNFEAAGEDMLVRYFSVANCLTASATFSVSCAEQGESLGDDDVASVVRISYLDVSGATLTKSGFLSGHIASFDNLDMFIPAGSSRVLTVTIDTNTVGSTGAASGAEIQLGLDLNSSAFLAVGVSSGVSLLNTQVGPNVTGSPMTIHKTKPTFSLASGSPSGAGVPGLSEVMRFNVAADSRGFVTLSGILFKVSGFIGEDLFLCDTLAEATKWELFDLDDPSTKLDDDADWEFFDAIGSPCQPGIVARYALLDFRTDPTHPSEEIGAGETKTYELRVDTTGAQPGDSIRIDIPDQDELNALPVLYSSVIWDDEDLLLGLNGQFVKNLPVIGGTTQY